MTRQRDIPSISYRSQNQINMTLPKREGILRYNIRGAATLLDAYGANMGLAGFGTKPMFTLENGGEFRSRSILSRRLPAVEESRRGLSRAVFDLDDFATPFVVGDSHIPSDDFTLFMRVEAVDTAGTVLPEGPIQCIPPYDFFSTKEPVFTVTARAPNLAIGAFPPNLPEALVPGVLNFLLPAYNTTISIRNLEAPGGTPLFMGFHPGMPPTVLMPGDDVSLTGSGAPEFFVASPDGNAWFTVRIAVVNSA